MTHTKNKPGYVLTLTLALIALCMFISTYVFNKGFVFVRFSHTMIEREKARQLAYGGVQLAISQLAAFEKKPEKEKKDEKAAAPASDGASLLKTLLPILNKPQKFTLKQPIDGINGTISITLGSEEGKININRLYDFEKHAFVGEGQASGDMKKMFQELFTLIKEKNGADLFADFEKFLKERKYPLNDPSELLKVKGFDVFKQDIFYDPTMAKTRDEKDKIFLNDVFTVASSKKEIEPWLFSNSLITLLNLKPEKPSEELLKNFKEQADWKNDWNKVLKPFYGVEFNALPKTIAALLNPAFNPQMFNVLSQATVGKVTVTLFVLLEREKSADKNAAPSIHIRGVYLV
jgi:hypothetical protein